MQLTVEFRALERRCKALRYAVLRSCPSPHADQADNYGKPSAARTQENGPQVHSYSGTPKCCKFNADIMMIFKADLV